MHIWNLKTWITLSHPSMVHLWYMGTKFKSGFPEFRTNIFWNSSQSNWLSRRWQGDIWSCLLYTVHPWRKRCLMFSIRQFHSSFSHLSFQVTSPLVKARKGKNAATTNYWCVSDYGKMDRTLWTIEIDVRRVHTKTNANAQRQMQNTERHSNTCTKAQGINTSWG